MSVCTKGSSKPMNRDGSPLQCNFEGVLRMFLSILEQGTLEKIPLKNNSVDVTLCSNVLTHIPNIGPPLKEMLRVSKKI